MISSIENKRKGILLPKGAEKGGITVQNILNCTNDNQIGDMVCKGVCYTYNIQFLLEHLLEQVPQCVQLVEIALQKHQ